MWVDVLIVTVCLLFIWLVSDRMVAALSSLAAAFQIPQSVAGATLAAIGSSAPELATNALALGWAARVGEAGNIGQADIGYAAVFGSAIFNLCLIIGIPAMIRPLRVQRRAVLRDGLVYLLAVGLTIAFIADRQVTALEAAALVFTYLLYLGALLRDVWLHPEATEVVEDFTPAVAAGTFAVSLAVIGVTCYFLVRSTIGLAVGLGLPTALVSLFAVAIGTALPDLVASIQAARQGNTSLAVSNAIGTNSFDLLIALGLPTLIYDLLTGSALQLGGGTPIEPHIPAQLSGDLMLLSAVYLGLVLAIALVLLIDRPSLERTHGAGLIALYPLFVLLVLGLWRGRESFLGRDTPIWNGPLSIGVIGAVGAVALLLALLSATRWLLARGGQVGAVARHVVEEALRAKAAVVPMALLVLLLPIMPLVLDPGQPLRYRIQTCLSYTLTITSVLLSLMTVLLATSTLSGEIFGRQIYTVIVKPIDRGRYLFGRWLGLMWLNGVLLMLVAVLISVLVNALAALPGVDRKDELAIAEEVLVARVAARPDANPRATAEVERRLEKVRESNPELIDQYGEATVRTNLTEEVAKRWYSLGYRRSRTYVFRGLHDARDSRTVALRLKAFANQSPPSGNLRVLLQIGKLRAVPLPLAIDQFQTYMLSREQIDQALEDDGTLRVTIVNVDRSSDFGTTITFGAVDGLEILYAVDDFTPNLIRTLLIVWIKLGFLAAIGLATASYMTFPVACLVCLVALFIINTSGFLLDASRYYALANKEVQVAKGVSYFVGNLAHLASKYSSFTPADQLVDGRLVPWSAVGSCLLWIGVVWTGVAGLGAYLIFRLRELARVLV